MIPVVQSIVGDGKDGRPMGDCFRACVASIFKLPLYEVPHFAESPSWYRNLGRWIAARGPIHVENDTNREIVEVDGKRVARNKRTEIPHRWHRGYWIASVNSENFGGDATHAVVMFDGEVAHDPLPHPRRTPYEFIGGTWFVCTDPAAIGRMAEKPNAPDCSEAPTNSPCGPSTSVTGGRIDVTMPEAAP